MREKRFSTEAHAGRRSSEQRSPRAKRVLVAVIAAVAALYGSSSLAGGLGVVGDTTPESEVNGEAWEGLASLPDATPYGDGSSAGEGSYPPAVTLQSIRDADGTIWRAITRESNDGRCLEVEALSQETGQPFGMVGGCGIPDVAYDENTGFRRHDREKSGLLPIGGRLDTGSATGTVLFGLASCECDIHVRYSDGAASSARARRGFYLLLREGVDVNPVRIEALDDAGRVVTSYDLPTPTESPLGGELLRR